jgi:hypothetical protein
MIAELIKIPIMAGGHYMWSIVIANGIVICVAVFMTFRSKRVAELILRKSKSQDKS